MFFSALFAGLGAGAALIVAIGAQNLFVLRQGLRREHVGLVVALCATADAVLITLGVAGLGLLVQGHAAWLPWLRYAGSAFLWVYGAMALRRAWQGEVLPQEVAGTVVRDRRRIVLTCLAFTLLNPHVYLDTVVLLGSLSTRFGATGRWAFALGAISASALWFCGLGFGARLLVPLFRNARAWRWLDGAVAAVMWGLALVIARGAG